MQGIAALRPAENGPDEARDDSVRSIMRTPGGRLLCELQHGIALEIVLTFF
jgi:hypothetical protein